MFGAVQPAPVVQPAQPDSQSDVIEVIGTRADQTQKIDRRTYRVQQNPHSEQKNAIQLLRGLPAVTVTPDDEIELLGSGSKIFVNGRPYVGQDVTAFLHTLHGSDIERIEVITNPSAQYSAEGTGGIINFVLRQKRSEGVSGSVSTEASSIGHGEATASITDKHGKWTYEVQAVGDAGRIRRSHYFKRRSVENAPGAAPTVNTETGGGPSRESSGFASGKVTYELDSKTNISAMIFGAGWRSSSTNHAEFRGLTPDFESFSERQRSRTSGSGLFGQMDFDHKGSRQGETLNATLRFDMPRQHESNEASFSNGGALSTDKAKHFRSVDAKIDWQHPMGKGEILSVGGSWSYDWMSERYAFSSAGIGGGLGGSASDQFEGAENTLAAYLTFQQPIGKWTVMPGLRMERDSHRISGPGEPEVRVARSRLFPTLHVEHALSKAVDLTLSYSKRIDRRGLNDLRPYPLVQDVNTIKIGNPELKDQSTDSYEINVHYHRKKVDVGLIVYDRATSHLWSDAYTAKDGITIDSVVNGGHSVDRGAEFDVTTPIVRRVKLMGSVNLFDRRAPFGVSGEMDERFRYTTNATLEWDGPDRGKTPGDIAQLQWLHSGPSRNFQIESFAWNFLSLSYSHSFSQTLSLTGTLNYAGANGHRLVAPLVQEYFTQRSPVEFKLKLLKTFGNPKSVPVSPPPVPIPH